MLGQAFVVHLPAERAQVALDDGLHVARLAAFVEVCQQRRPQIERDQVKRILVHGALLPELEPSLGLALAAKRGGAFPGEGEDHALVGA